MNKACPDAGFYKSILDASLEGVLVVSAQGELLYANAALIRLLDLPHGLPDRLDRLLKHSFPDATKRNAALEHWQRDSLLGQPPERLFAVTMADGTRCWRRFQMSRGLEGERIVAVSDGGPRVDMEDALRESEAALPWRVNLTGGRRSVLWWPCLSPAWNA